MIKNLAGQKLAVFAWNSGAGAPKTGDAANITGQISLDGGASAPTNDVNPTELDATNHPGIYLFDLTQAETNADVVVLTPKSSTSGVVFKPVVAYPTMLTPTNLTDLVVAGLLSGDLGDDQEFAPDTLADRFRKLFWAICNRLVITDATGAFTIYKDDGVTPAAAGTITDNGATTARSKPTWP